MKGSRRRRQTAAGSSRQGRAKRQEKSHEDATDHSDAVEKKHVLRGKQVESDGDATDESEIDSTPFTVDAEQEYRLTPPTPEEITIVFVEALERAHQFFEFKDFLDKCVFIKHDSNREDIFLKLVKMDDRKSLFNKLDEQTIMGSVADHITDLEFEKMRMLHSKIPSDTLLSKQDNKRRRIIENLMLKSKESPFPDPVLELVHQARKGKYMRLNPVSEHDKIKKSHPAFYKEAFFFYKSRPEIHYSETTVTVTFHSADYTDAKMEELLSVCGEVQTIERRRLIGRTKVAHVTFKNSEAAKIAPFVMAPKSIIVEGIPESRSCRSLLEGGEDISSMHERALEMYSLIRSTYMERCKKKTREPQAS